MRGKGSKVGANPWRCTNEWTRKRGRGGGKEEDGQQAENYAKSVKIWKRGKRNPGKRKEEGREEGRGGRGKKAEWQIWQNPKDKGRGRGEEEDKHRKRRGRAGRRESSVIVHWHFCCWGGVMIGGGGGLAHTAWKHTLFTSSHPSVDDETEEP